MTVQIPLIQQLLDETGIDARCIYCQATGKIIGRLTDEAMADTFAAIPAYLESDDIKSELLERTLVASRPSPAWIKRRMDRKSDYDWGVQLLRQDPVSIGAYLFNRFYSLQSRDRNSESRTYWQMQQIRMHSRVGAAKEKSPELFDKILLVLLEVDAKYGLAGLAIPPAIHATPEFDPFPEAMAEMLKALEAWRTDLNVRREKEIAANKASDRSFLNGNRSLSFAYLEEWRRQTPPSERTASNLARENKRIEIGDMFDELERELTKVHSDGSKPIALMSEARDKQPRQSAMRPSIPTAAKFVFRGLGQRKESEL